MKGSRPDPENRLSLGKPHGCGLFVDWRCPCWRSSTARQDVLSATLAEFINRGKDEILLVVFLGVFEQFFQERSAPSTPRARAKALTELSRFLRFFDPQVIDYLTPGHVETEAEFIVKFHL